MRIAVVVPIDPELRGNGLAHRSRFWCAALRELGNVTTVVVPVAGPAPESSASSTLVVGPEQLDHPWHPQLAQHAPEYLGARWSNEIEPFDVIVGHRLYLAPFCIGLRGASEAQLLIDLDDHDANLHHEMGSHDEAEKYAALAEWVTTRVDLIVSATSAATEFIVPNAVPLPPDHPGEQPVPVDPPMILLVGNLSYEPNREGLRWFESRVLPLVRDGLPDAQFVVAGPHSNHLSSDGVGFVDDLRGLYEQASVAVVPLMHGSGSRIKALEAWAHRVPVVGTSVGLAGLQAADSNAALIADTAVAFAAAISELLADEPKRRAMGDAGRSHVELHFSTTAVAEQTRGLVASLAHGEFQQRLTQGVDLDVGEVDDGLAIYEPSLDTAHHLNPTASIIFSLAEHPTTLEGLSAEFAELSGDATVDEHAVSAVVDELVTKRLLRHSRTHRTG